MKNFFLLAMLALPLLLDGCYTPLIEGAQEGYDAITLRDEIMEQATRKERARTTPSKRDRTIRLLRRSGSRGDAPPE